MIDDDHVNLEITRVAIEPEKFEGKEENELVTGLHALACMAAYHEWSSLFTFVLLLDEGFIDHITVGVEDTTPADFMKVPITEAVRFHSGKVLAVAIHLGAYAGTVDDDGNKVLLKESKYVITVAAENNIIVSEMHRDVETKIVDNEGKWKTSSLDHVEMDSFGEVKETCREIQQEIQQQRGKREPNV